MNPTKNRIRIIFNQSENFIEIRSVINREILKNYFIFTDNFDELQNYLNELKKLEDEYKKEIILYKKSLIKLKESLNDFYRECKSSTKLRKNINDINNSILQMEKLLG